MVLKTILVPTDFSEPARNALDYAVVLARIFNAKLTILNVYQIPMVSVRGAYLANTPVAIENRDQAEQQLQSLVSEVEALKNIDFETKLVPSYWVMEIPEIIQSHNADLTVMGTHGTGVLKEIVLGSNTGNVIQLSEKPVMAIPRDAQFKEIKNMAFAYDQESIADISGLDIVRFFAKTLNASIEIFHVMEQAPIKETSDPSEEVKALTGYLGTAVSTYSEFYGTEMEEIINKFIEDKQIDLLIMMPRRYTLFQKLFKSSLTKKMTFHSKTPLLAVRE